MKHTFTGSQEQVYPQYLDKATGGTLVAVPGETYDIAQAEGLTAPAEPDEDGNTTTVPVKLPMPPDDQWAKPTSNNSQGSS